MLHDLCIKGDSEEISRFLVDNEIDVNAIDGKGYTPLHVASRNGNLEVVRLLLDKGADKDINAKSIIGETPLHYASRNLELVRLLLDKGADKYINAKDNGGYTPLHVASKNGNLEVVRLLLDKGANKDINAKSNIGLTPLHYASRSGNLEVVRLLLDLGADINAKGPGGRTPLHYASRRGNLEVVRLLLDLGADINAKSKFGETPLNCALEGGDGNLEVVRLLLDMGADADSKQLPRASWFAEPVTRAMTAAEDLVQRASITTIPSGEETTLQFIDRTDLCYQHTTRVRQVRQPIVSLVNRCCAVLQGMENVSFKIPESIEAAEIKLKGFDTLQNRIRESATVHDGTLAERDRVRRECVRLINTALTELDRQPKNLDVVESAVETLACLRGRSDDKPVNNPKSLEQVRSMCSEARHLGETYAVDLGYNSTLSSTTDTAVTVVRAVVVSGLLQEYGYEGSSSESARRECMRVCATSLEDEMKFQSDSASKMSCAVLIQVLGKLERALEAIVAYFEQVKTSATRITTHLQRRQARLMEGLTAPNMDLARQRKKWRGRVLMALMATVMVILSRMMLKVAQCHTEANCRTAPSE